MFAPDINTTKNQLTTLFNEVNGITGYSSGIRGTIIGKIPSDPDWLPKVRSEMQLLSKAGGQWIDTIPTTWADIITSFINYGTDFEAFSEKIQKDLKSLTPNQVVDLLTELSKSLDNCARVTKTSLDTLTDFENQFLDVFPLLKESIQAGWDELGDEEAEMVAIAEAITKLQDDISSLESKIDAAGISGGKSFVQTEVKIAYSILTATTTVAIPYLSVAVVVFTLGKSFYDIISGTDKINSDLSKIVDLQVKATEEAQAVALTKATIQYLYNIEIQFYSLKKHGDGLWTMWKDQKVRIDEAINAINGNADPSKFLDILTMDVASKNWKSILEFSNQLLSMTPQFGPEVVLQPKKIKTT